MTYVGDFLEVGRSAYGLLQDDLVEDILGSPFDTFERTGRLVPLSSVKIEVPVIPRTFYAAGLNYVSYVRDMAAIIEDARSNLPGRPEIGYRATNALIAHGEAIVLPPDATEKVQYEGELVGCSSERRPQAGLRKRGAVVRAGLYDRQ